MAPSHIDSAIPNAVLLPKLKHQLARVLQRQQGHAAGTVGVEQHVGLDKLPGIHQRHMARAVLGEQHPDTLGCLSNLACDQAAIGDDELALRTAEGAWEHYRLVKGSPGPVDPATGWESDLFAGVAES